MAKSKAEPQVASLVPSEFSQGGGLKSDFRATITEAVYCEWDYKGTTDPVLGVRLTLAVEGEDEPYVDYWPAGSLDFFVPSEDGKSPAEAEDGDGYGEGPFAFRVGKRPSLSSTTNFAHLMETIVAAGAVDGKFGEDELRAGAGSLEVLVGLDAHWDRIPQKVREGMAQNTKKKSDDDDDDDDEDKPKKKEYAKKNDFLAVSSIYGYRTGKKKSKAADVKAKAKAAPVEDDDDDDDDEPEVKASPVDAKLTKIIVNILKKKSPIKRSKLAALVLEAAGTDKDKAAMVKRAGQDEFLSDGAWSYDEEAETLSLTDEDDDE